MHTNDRGETFGAWLLDRAGDGNNIGRLAAVAKGDRRFRSTSASDDLRMLLRADMADGDAFESVDEAETDWLTL